MILRLGIESGDATERAKRATKQPAKPEDNFGKPEEDPGKSKEQQGRPKKWTDEESMTMRGLFQQGCRIWEVVSHLGRTELSISRKIVGDKEIGTLLRKLKPRKGRFSSGEIAYLISQRLQGLQPYSIAKKLSRKSVYVRRHIARHVDLLYNSEEGSRFQVLKHCHLRLKTRSFMVASKNYARVSSVTPKRTLGRKFSTRKLFNHGFALLLRTYLPKSRNS
jgi:hypothetical protein